MENKYHSDNKHHRRKSMMIRFGISLLVIAVIVVAIILLTRGKMTSSGDYPNPIETNSLVCTKHSAKYPKITSTDSDSKTLEISMIFSGTTSLRKIALEYTLNYKTKEEVERAEALAHAELGKDLGGHSELSFTEFDNNFAVYNDKLVISLYGSESDFSSELRASYFMVDIKKQGIPKSLSDFRKIYKNQGFNCNSTTDE